MKEEGTWIEEAATKRSAKEGGCVFRQCYGDKFSLRKALIINQVVLCEG